MDVFVINLDRSPERWHDLSTRAKAAGFQPVRFAAIDGQDLPAADLARLRALQSGSYPALGARELGCFLSHHALWQAHLASGKNWVLILEDDVHFSGLAPLLDHTHWLPEDADLVKCEAFPEKARLGPPRDAVPTDAAPRGMALARLRGRYHGTGGYFLSRRGAAKLLALATSRVEAVDRLIFDIALRGQACVIYQTIPAPVIQDAFLRGPGKRGYASTLDAERTPQPVPSPTSPRWQRLRQKPDLRRLAPLLCRLTSRDRIMRVRYHGDMS